MVVHSYIYVYYVYSYKSSNGGHSIYYARVKLSVCVNLLDRFVFVDRFLDRFFTSENRSTINIRAHRMCDDDHPELIWHGGLVFIKR